MADAGFTFGPSLTTLAATAIPTSRPPARVALKPPLFPGKPRRSIDTRGYQIHYSDALASSVHEMRMCKPAKRPWTASRAASPSWSPALGTSLNAPWRDSSAPWSAQSSAGSPSRQKFVVTPPAQQRTQPKLHRTSSSVSVFGQGLSALRAKTPPGQRLANLRDSDLHKFLSRPMYAGLYLLEPRQRTPRGEDGDAMRLGGSGGGPSRSGSHRAGMKQSSKDLQRSVRMVSEAAGREDELLFQLADANSDWNLSFEEFRALVTARLPKLLQGDAETLHEREAQLKDWYRALDANGDGKVDPYEYFLFAVRECLFRAEQHREAELRKLTTGGESVEQSAFNILFHGGLESREGRQYVSRRAFKKLAVRLGFGSDVGETVFEAVLVDYLLHHGRRAEAIEPSKSTTAIEATFLLKSIQKQTNQLKPLLVQWMAKRPGAPGRDSPTRDHIEAARQLRFDEKTLAELRDLPADDVHGMLRTLRAALRSDNMQRVHAIFRAWDTNASLAVGMAEFQQGLAELGFGFCPPQVVQRLFDELDDNQSYQLDFREFKRWLNGSDAGFERQLHDPEYA